MLYLYLIKKHHISNQIQSVKIMYFKNLLYLTCTYYAKLIWIYYFCQPSKLKYFITCRLTLLLKLRVCINLLNYIDRLSNVCRIKDMAKLSSSEKTNSSGCWSSSVSRLGIRLVPVGIFPFLCFLSACAHSNVFFCFIGVAS